MNANVGALAPWVRQLVRRDLGDEFSFAQLRAAVVAHVASAPAFVADQQRQRREVGI